MRFRRKINDGIHAATNCRRDCLRIANVAVHETVADVGFYVAEICGVACIGHRIEIDDLDGWTLT